MLTTKDTDAEAINEAHRLATEALRIAKAAANSGLDWALACGDMLTEKKAQVKGDFRDPRPKALRSWSGWVKENLDFSQRTAQAYMRVYAGRKALEKKRNAVAFLSFRGALLYLQESRCPTPSELSPQETHEEETTPITDIQREKPESPPEFYVLTCTHCDWVGQSTDLIQLWREEEKGYTKLCPDCRSAFGYLRRVFPEEKPESQPNAGPDVEAGSSGAGGSPAPQGQVEKTDGTGRLQDADGGTPPIVEGVDARQGDPPDERRSPGDDRGSVGYTDSGGLRGNRTDAQTTVAGKAKTVTSSDEMEMPPDPEPSRHQDLIEKLLLLQQNVPALLKRLSNKEYHIKEKQSGQLIQVNVDEAIDLFYAVTLRLWRGLLTSHDVRLNPPTLEDALALTREAGLTEEEGREWFYSRDRAGWLYRAGRRAYAPVRNLKSDLIAYTMKTNKGQSNGNPAIDRRSASERRGTITFEEVQRTTDEAATLLGIE